MLWLRPELSGGTGLVTQPAFWSLMSSLSCRAFLAPGIEHACIHSQPELSFSEVQEYVEILMTSG